MSLMPQTPLWLALSLAVGCGAATTRTTEPTSTAVPDGRTPAVTAAPTLAPGAALTPTPTFTPGAVGAYGHTPLLTPTLVPPLSGFTLSEAEISGLLHPGMRAALEDLQQRVGSKLGMVQLVRAEQVTWQIGRAHV